MWNLTPSFLYIRIRATHCDRHCKPDLFSKGYLAPEVYQAQANEISAELAKLKDVRQEKFNSKAAIMLEEVKKLKMLIFELEEPLDAFDEKLFLEIVKSIQINKEDEMSVELLGGLRFRERI